MAGLPFDPFGERRRRDHRRTFRLLGAHCEIRSNDRRALALVEEACGELPPQRLPGGAPRCRLELFVSRGGRDFGARGPPPVHAGSAAGVLTGVIDADNHAFIAPQARSASVALSESMLAHPYHARYELIEFALLTLLSRVSGLVPLHAACVGDGRHGVLLLGNSGTGKSTLCFHAAIDGLQLLAEDSLFVQPDTLVSCALPAFVHLRRDAAAMLGDAALVRSVRASPLIRRRSGEQKFEVDLRRLPRTRISGPLRLVAVAGLTRARRHGAARCVDARSFEARLRREQAYATAQPGWAEFLAGVLALPAFEIARGAHPRDSVASVRGILRQYAR